MDTRRWLYGMGSGFCSSPEMRSKMWGDGSCVASVGGSGGCEPGSAVTWFETEMRKERASVDRPFGGWTSVGRRRGLEEVIASESVGWKGRVVGEARAEYGQSKRV